MKCAYRFSQLNLRNVLKSESDVSTFSGQVRSEAKVGIPESLQKLEQKKLFLSKTTFWLISLFCRGMDRSFASRAWLAFSDKQKISVLESDFTQPNTFFLYLIKGCCILMIGLRQKNYDFLLYYLGNNTPRFKTDLKIY